MPEDVTAVEMRPHLRLLHGMRRPANWLQLVRFGLVGGLGGPGHPPLTVLAARLASRVALTTGEGGQLAAADLSSDNAWAASAGVEYRTASVLSTCVPRASAAATSAVGEVWKNPA